MPPESSSQQATHLPQDAGQETYPPIEAYAVLGDGHSAALVSRSGSIDWYCPARFDAPAVFCRLLDARKGGYFRLAPPGAFASRRCYRGATNVLETTFTAGEQKARVTDFMPVHRPTATGHKKTSPIPQRLLRLVEGLSANTEIELRFRPTFNYASAQTELQPMAEGGAVARAAGQTLTLACSGLTLEPDGEGGLRGRLRLRSGERRWVALTYQEEREPPQAVLSAEECEQALTQTLAYWEEWTRRCTYRGPYREEVLRSALVLKLLIYQPTGALVAAPTTSLPEAIGGVRNWDYRYCWLRDTSLMLYALMTIGYHQAAGDFFRWLERTEADDPAPLPQIMYTVDGGRDLPEVVLDHLEGYRGSRPVRIGNAATKQRQLDILGEILNAAYFHFYGGAERARSGPADLPPGAAPGAAPGERPSRKTWAMLRGLVEQAGARWREPDRSIWEVRSGPQRFLYSALMCWAALDRGIRLAGQYRLAAPLARWCRTRTAIREAILSQGFDPARGAFTQALGSPALDASALVIPRIGFLPVADARVQATIERIRAELTHDGLVYRYRTHDGLPGGEATFAVCSFWLVDALALSRRLDEAHDLFERVIAYANDVGLLSEEIHVSTGALLGNFPQGFTHLGLIGSAVTLAKVARHGIQRDEETEAERALPASRAAAEGHSAR